MRVINVVIVCALARSDSSLGSSPSPFNPNYQPENLYTSNLSRRAARPLRRRPQASQKPSFLSRTKSHLKGLFTRKPDSQAAEEGERSEVEINDTEESCEQLQTRINHMMMIISANTRELREFAQNRKAATEEKKFECSHTKDLQNKYFTLLKKVRQDEQTIEELTKAVGEKQAERAQREAELAELNRSLEAAGPPETEV